MGTLNGSWPIEVESSVNKAPPIAGRVCYRLPGKYLRRRERCQEDHVSLTPFSDPNKIGPPCRLDEEREPGANGRGSPQPGQARQGGERQPLRLAGGVGAVSRIGTKRPTRLTISSGRARTRSRYFGWVLWRRHFDYLRGQPAHGNWQEAGHGRSICTRGSQPVPSNGVSIWRITSRSRARRSRTGFFT